MGSDAELARLRPVMVAMSRSLRIRGFFGGPGLFRRRRLRGFDIVRLETELDRTGATRLRIALSRQTDDGRAEWPAEVSLWDLMPARDRGGLWRVAPTSRVEAVARDVVEAVERYGLPALDREVTHPD
ncbi:MAG: hypothetical protein AB7L66_02145 [Gemmatimonadales bacterium]